MNLRWLLVLSTVSLSLFPASMQAESAEAAWKRAFKQCGQSELSGNKVLFFGTSNTVGIGSVWSKSDSGYNLRFDLPKLVPDASKRAEIIKPGLAPSECSGTHTGGLSLAISLPFLQVFSSLTGFKSNWNSASNTSVVVDKISLDMLNGVDFESMLAEVAKADAHNIYYKDTTEKGRLVMNKAFRVSGITVKSQYTPDQLKDLKTKYPNGGSINVGGDKGATLDFSYDNQNTLTLKTTGDIYIAGEFAKIEGGRVALNGNPAEKPLTFIPVDSRKQKIGPPDPIQP